MTTSPHFSIIPKNDFIKAEIHHSRYFIILRKKNNVEQPRHNLTSQQLSQQTRLQFLFIPYTPDQTEILLH